MIMTSTRRILCYGAPSSGKSTMSALIFAKLKLKGKNAELVQEFAKTLVWKSIDIKAGGDTLQLEIFLNQMKQEQDLEGRVEYMVSDSPLLLNAYYGKSELTKQIARAKISSDDFHFWLTRTNVKFEAAGRIHDEEESKNIEIEMVKFLKDSGVNLIIVDADIDKRADWIVDYVLKATGK